MFWSWTSPALCPVTECQSPSSLCVGNVELQPQYVCVCVPVSCWLSCMETALARVGGVSGHWAKKDMTDYHPYMAPGGGCAEPFKTHKDHSM